MLNLIIKDIAVQKKTIPLALLYVVFFLVLAGEAYKKGSIYVIGVTLTYMFSLGAMQYDERYKADCIIASLPVNRKDIVISRYLATIFFTAASTAFMLIITWVMSIFNVMPSISWTNIHDLKLIIVISLLLMAVIIPLNYRFSAKKVRYINVLSYLAFFFVIISFYDESQIFFNSSLMLFLKQYSVLLSVAAFAVSIGCSLLIYQNKDLV